MPSERERMLAEELYLASGGGAIIGPGVTIGNGSVIGAGGVVTRDIPSGMVATGNPCRAIRAVL